MVTDAPRQLTYRWLVLLALPALLALALAATLPVPRLYLPLYVAGLLAAGALCEGVRQLLTYLAGSRANAGLAMLCGLLALVLHWVIFELDVPPMDVGSPAPVRPELLFLAQLQAVAAVVGVFGALYALADKGAAWLGLLLSLAALYLIGARGLELLPAQVAVASVAITSAILLMVWVSRSLFDYFRAQRK